MFRKIRAAATAFAEGIGTVVSTVILTACYLVVLPFFAIPFRLGSKRETGWSEPTRQFEGLADFTSED